MASCWRRTETKASTVSAKADRITTLKQIASVRTCQIRPDRMGDIIERFAQFHPADSF